MKKIFLIVLFLFIPIIVMAESDLPEHELVDRFRVPNMVQISSQQKYMYAESYEYENGVYTLIDPVSTYASRIRYNAPVGEIPIVYTCKSETETSCEMLYGVYCKVSTITDDRLPIVGLVNGETFEEKMWVKLGTGFHKEGNVYILDNPYDYRITDFNSRDEELIDKYFCSDFKEQCEEILYITERDRSGVVVYTINDDIVVSNDYEYDNGKFILKDKLPSAWPNYNEYVGKYTCFSKEDSCETLYQLSNYTKEEYLYGQGYFDSINPNHFDGKKIEVSTKTLSLEKRNKYNLSSLIKNTSKVAVEDEKILKIENMTIVPLRIGKTNVIIQNEKDVLLLNVEITDKDFENPNTGQNIMIFIMIGITALTITVLLLSKRKK